MAKIYLICGKIGSGKTYYAKKLLEEARTVALSCDDFTKIVFNNDLGDRHDVTMFGVKRYFLQKAVEICACGVNVVLDWGFWTRTERAEITEFLNNSCVLFEWHYMDISDERLRENITARNQSLADSADCSNFYVDNGLLEKCLSQFEEPEPSEVDVWHILQEGVHMAFDYKKEYKEFYMPKNKPEIVNIPKMNFIAVRGVGDPNEEGGAYKEAIGLLYAIAFTIKMSKKGSHQIDGYFDYVVPPLEGFWWQEGIDGIDYSRKDEFHWISVIRLPDFVMESDFAWAVEEATRKKKTDFSKVEFLTIEEGMCVQCMHIGPFDREPETIALMDQFLQENGYENDFSKDRLHHEIYLSDARRVPAEKWRTVIRHPIRKK